jgi:hypothetical protein
MTRTTKRAAPRVWVAAVLAGFAAAAFVIVLAAFTCLHFPREVAFYKARPGIPSTAFSREFGMKRGPAGNLWTLEIELGGDLKPGQDIFLSLNGAPVAALNAGRKTQTLEFPGSLLRDGTNSLRLDSPLPFFCPKFRVINVSGYASGLVAAVVFPKTNGYPGIPGWPSSAWGWALVILMGAGLAVLDFLSGKRPDRPRQGTSLRGEADRLRPGRRRVFRILRGARYTIPVLFLAIAAAPLLSRYKVLVELRSVLFLAWVYLGLAYGRDVGACLARAGAILWKLGRTAFLGIRPALVRVPFLKTWDRALSAALLGAFVFISLPGPTRIGGDGIEYYAMTVSLARFGTPYITPESAAATSQLVGWLPWVGDEPLYDWLKRVLNPLVRNGRELDPTHFWFYSLLAAVFFWPLRLLALGPAYAFVLLHIALMFLAFAVVRKKLGPLAGVCLMLIVFGSPLPWFITRPQVELFTALLGIIGVACLVAEDYLPAAFAFAAAATQNPPFAILAGLVFLFGFARKKWGILKGTFPLWAAAGLLSLINPAYYYLRHGVLNPIVAAGAAKLGPDLYTGKKMFSIFFDPDIGLFPDWPLALALLVAFMILAFRKKAGLKAPVWTFLGLSTLILLWSQSSTLNFNHGGTYHITRYALWYTPVFFLALWRLVAALPSATTGLSETTAPTGLSGLSETTASAGRIVARRAAIAGAAVLCLIQGYDYRPTRPETYLEQTRLSRYLYDHAPGLFNPYPEVFMERQTGMEEYPPDGIWAVSNKSGNKILVMRGRLFYQSEAELPPVPYDLDLDPVLVYKEALRRAGDDRSIGYFYINGMSDKLRRTQK